MQCASTSTYPENLGSGGLFAAELGGRVCLFFCLSVCLSVTLRCQAQKAQTVCIRIELGRNGHKPPGHFQFSFQFSFSFSFQFQFYSKRRHILLQRQQAIEPFQFSLILVKSRDVNFFCHQWAILPYALSPSRRLPYYSYRMCVRVRVPVLQTQPIFLRSRVSSFRYEVSWSAAGPDRFSFISHTFCVTATSTQR